MTNHDTTNVDGHFDRSTNLIPLLESFTSFAELPAMTVGDYKKLTFRKRNEFDDLRVSRLTDSIAGGIIVKTPALSELLLELRRAARFASRPIGRTSVVLTGEPTAGKTTASFYAMVEAFGRHVNRHPEWKALGHMPLVYVEVPEKCTAKSLMGRFLLYLGLPFTERMTLEERTQLVTEHLVRSRTSFMVIDEMQNTATRGEGRSETQQAIKNLMNVVPATPLYVGWNLEQKLLAGDSVGAQFASRSSMVRLDSLGARTTNERALWGGVVKTFESKLGLLNQTPLALLEDAEYLWQRTRGSLAALSRLLTTVTLDLIEDGDPEAEFITRERLDAVRLDLTTTLSFDRASDLAATTTKSAVKNAA